MQELFAWHFSVSYMMILQSNIKNVFNIDFKIDKTLVKNKKMSLPFFGLIRSEKLDF